MVGGQRHARGGLHLHPGLQPVAVAAARRRPARGLYRNGPLLRPRPPDADRQPGPEHGRVAAGLTGAGCGEGACPPPRPAQRQAGRPRVTSRPLVRAPPAAPAAPPSSAPVPAPPPVSAPMPAPAPAPSNPPETARSPVE